MLKSVSMKLYDILDKNGFYKDEAYHSYNSNGKHIYDVIYDFLREEEKIFQFIIHITPTFDFPPSYSYSVLSISWIEDGELNLENIVLEDY